MPINEHLPADLPAIGQELRTHNAHRVCIRHERLLGRPVVAERYGVQQRSASSPRSPSMMMSTKGSVWTLIKWQRSKVILYAAAAGVPAGVHVALGWDWAVIPIIPLSIVGAAIGIFVSFRTNSAYDRWWEGRKLWGRLINSSRMFATQATTYLDLEQPELASASRRLVIRQTAYVHVLRCLLRKQDPMKDGEIARIWADSDVADLVGRSNMTHALLQQHQTELVALHKAGHIDALQLQSFDRTIAALLDIQGGCERIKKTPLPRGYGFIAEQLVRYFSVLLPWAIVPELGLLVIPANILVCLSFELISEAGRVLEDPFSLFFNGLPLNAMSRTIEVNLREVLGETELPPLLKPNQQGILM
ncbi:MAG: bestrophin family protein [Myxococcota bacterium]